jgi:hypothetical protein
MRGRTVEKPFGTINSWMENALPDEDAGQRRNRNGAARSGLQLEARDAYDRSARKGPMLRALVVSFTDVVLLRRTDASSTRATNSPLWASDAHLLGVSNHNLERVSTQAFKLYLSAGYVKFRRLRVSACMCKVFRRAFLRQHPYFSAYCTLRPKNIDLRRRTSAKNPHIPAHTRQTYTNPVFPRLSSSQ